MTSKIKDNNSIDVYYNDTCPICKREIEIYKSKSTKLHYHQWMISIIGECTHTKMGRNMLRTSAFLLIWKILDLSG